MPEGFTRLAPYHYTSVHCMAVSVNMLHCIYVQWVKWSVQTCTIYNDTVSLSLPCHPAGLVEVLAEGESHPGRGASLLSLLRQIYTFGGQPHSISIR